MRLSYKQLGNYIDLAGVSPDQLADRLTTAGFEVEEVVHTAQATKLVIGHVDQCVAHPDSDHLHVCQVNDGSGLRQVVCGAPNVAAGENVILALPGCQLPGGTIESGVIRGQRSDGMLCSLAELGVDKKQLSEQQLAGIEILPADAPVGSPDVLSYLDLDDTILEVSLTPNRADCLSWWAMAMEVGAILDRNVKLPDYSYQCQQQPATLKVETRTEKCPVFYGRVINSVTIKPSPKWLQRSLQAAGIKVINNVVDISNFVMLETGQPLHFYDLAKIPAREITVVDNLKEGYTALDGVVYGIEPQDIMITTQGKAIGIAGIMGGDDSKIDQSTTGIIIEAASFNSAAIRSTARRLNLETEACQHFEKGIEPCGPIKAVERSTQLLLQLADAAGIEQSVIAGHNAYKPITIALSAAKTNALLATHFTIDEIAEPLARLGLQPRKDAAGDLVCTIPSYRTDLVIPEDLIEEVIRLKGYENIKASLPVMPTIQATYATAERQIRTIKKMMAGWGFNEAVTYSLTSPQKDALGLMSIGKPVALANPSSDQRRIYRTSLLPSLLDVAAYNESHSIDEFGIFEIANVYDDQGHQSRRLAMVQTAITTLSLWQKESLSNDFYAVKGYFSAILGQLGYDEKRISYAVNPQQSVILHPGRNALVSIDRHMVGVIGAINPIYAAAQGLGELVMAEMDIDAVIANHPAHVKFYAVPRYPSVRYDLAMIVGEDVTANEIVGVIRKAGGKLLANVEIFDVYKGLGIQPGEKSVAVTVIYQSADATLNEKDIAPVQAAITDALRHQLRATIRDTK